MEDCNETTTTATSSSRRCTAVSVLMLEHGGNVDPDFEKLYKDLQAKELEVWTGFRFYENEDASSPIAQADAESTTYKLVDDNGAQMIAASAVFLLTSAILLD